MKSCWFLCTCSVERYDPSRDSWETVAPMADKRIHFGVGVMLGFIFVVGGHNGVSHVSSIERYDPHQNQWTVCQPMKEPRTGRKNLHYCFLLVKVRYPSEQEKKFSGRAPAWHVGRFWAQSPASAVQGSRVESVGKDHSLRRPGEQLAICVCVPPMSQDLLGCEP